MLKIAVFVSGRGSNLKAVANAIKNREIEAEIAAVVSDKLDCPAFEIPREPDIPAYSVSVNPGEGYCDYNFLVQKFDELKIDLIVLAGFLKKIPDEFVDKFENRIINIHPALLPSFGGKGMYGMNVHKAVFDRSCQISGVTVHFVNKIYDDGRIIAQRCVDISDVGSPEEIAEKVLSTEHKLLPFVIGKISKGEVLIENNRVRILN
jgi:formyltetrahydrofolate-dependent phosphoribosylglycinamide formyltransferase